MRHLHPYALSTHGWHLFGVRCASCRHRRPLAERAHLGVYREHEINPKLPIHTLWKKWQKPPVRASEFYNNKRTAPRDVRSSSSSSAPVFVVVVVVCLVQRKIRERVWVRDAKHFRRCTRECAIQFFQARNEAIWLERGGAVGWVDALARRAHALCMPSTFAQHCRRIPKWQR